MSSWPSVRLEDCADIVSGATPRTSEPGYWGGDIYWATPKDLSELHGAYISRTPRRVTRRGLESCAATILPPESVLFSSRAPIGHVAINTVPMATNQGFKSFVPNRGRVDSKFLYHWLRCNRLYLESLGNGATFKEVSKAVVSRIEISLPPLPEQKRLAKVLDCAEALQVNRRATLAQLDTLTRAIFLDMFGDPAANPKGWQKCRVSDFVAEFRGGKSIDAEVSDIAVTRHRVLKVSAVTGMKYLPAESKPIPDSYEPPDEHHVRAGDLLFSRANTTDLVGAVALVAETPPRMLLPDKLWRFVWREPRLVEPFFVWALFQTPTLRYEIGRRATGTSGSMKNISQEKVMGIQSILPPIAIQSRFAGRLAQVERLRASYETSLAELESLFTALRIRAFCGGL